MNEPKNCIRFLDQHSGREMLLNNDPGGWYGWLFFRNPGSGEWVSLRQATEADRQVIANASYESEFNRLMGSLTDVLTGSKPPLVWKAKRMTDFYSSWEEAQLGEPSDGVLFYLTYHPTCYRRGPWRLLIEVCSGVNHRSWGYFDESDQPMRYYHDKQNAIREAQEIANVLWADRYNGNKN